MNTMNLSQQSGDKELFSGVSTKENMNMLDFGETTIDQIHKIGIKKCMNV
jgi:hypothetical protein